MSQKTTADFVPNCTVVSLGEAIDFTSEAPIPWEEAQTLAAASRPSLPGGAGRGTRNPPDPQAGQSQHHQQSGNSQNRNRRGKKKGSNHRENVAEKYNQMDLCDDDDGGVSVVDDGHPASEWLRQLRKQQSGEKVRQFFSMLYSGWLPAEAHGNFLEFLQRSPGIERQKIGGYAGLVLFNFENFLKEYKDAFSYVQISTELRMKAFCVATERSNCYLTRISRMFQLRRLPLDFVIPKAALYLRDHRYWTAIWCAIEFGIQGYFDESELEFLVMPIAMQNGNSTLMKFVGSNDRLANYVAKLVDRVVYIPFKAFDSLVKRFPGLEKQPIPRVAQGSMSKLLTKLIKGFSISQESLPNWVRKRKEGCMAYMARRRYQIEDLPPWNWEELMGDFMMDYPDMQRFSLMIIADKRRDPREAAKFATLLHIKEHLWPDSVRRFVDYNPEMVFHWTQQTDWVPSDDCLKLPMDHETHVVMIDTSAALRGAMKFIVGEAEEGKAPGPFRVGMDMEWSPHEIHNLVDQASVLQVATRDRVFLMDLRTLRQRQFKDWVPFVRELFCSDKLLKLGYSFEHDISALKAALPECAELLQNEMTHVLCIANLVSKFQLLNRNFVPNLPQKEREADSAPGDESSAAPGQKADAPPPPMAEVGGSGEGRGSEAGEASLLDFTLDSEDEEGEAKKKEEVIHLPKSTFKLTDLCGYFFGKKLDKIEQYSGWNRRPLRPAQKYYAALDAYCLLALYDAIKARAEELNLNFTEIVEGCVIKKQPV